MTAVAADTVSRLRARWTAATCPEPGELAGDWRAEFVRPLTRVAPVGLGLVGLPRWHGKRFRVTGTGVQGVNLLRAGGFGGTVETLPMAVRTGPSYADGAPALLVAYRPDGPRPWRWVRDELRMLEPGVLVGLTFVDVGPLRRLPGTPFLLTADAAAAGRPSRTAAAAPASPTNGPAPDASPSSPASAPRD